MPNWKTHLEIGKRINNKLKYTGSDLELFLLGNILPDINNGYVVRGISTIYNHDYTHYKEDDFYIYKSFSKYYDYKSNPLLYGYYIHLYTDFVFNNDYYSNLRDDIKKLTKDEKRIIKQSDFLVYNNNFITNKLVITDYDYIIKNIGMIDHVSINKDDLLKVINYLDNQVIYNQTLKYYSEDKLNSLLDKVVNDIVN